MKLHVIQGVLNKLDLKVRSKRSQMFLKVADFKNSQNSQENICARISILNNVAGAAKTTTQVFSCEFWETINNLRTTASRK